MGEHSFRSGSLKFLYLCQAHYLSSHCYFYFLDAYIDGLMQDSRLQNLHSQRTGDTAVLY